jgi:hypothetical protein
MASSPRTAESRTTGRAYRKLMAVIVTGSMLAVFAFAPAAHAGPTTTTFELTGGNLSMTSPTTANLGSAAAGALTLTGSLGENTVTDTRGLLLGWTASVISTDFAGPSETTVSAASASYAPGVVSKTGTVTVAAGAGGPMALSQTAVLATLVTGNNTATWTPDVTVTLLQAESLTGTYTATVTHSIA